MRAETYNTRVHSSDLLIRTQTGGQVQPIEQGWRLSLPAGARGRYLLAQLDDYGGLARHDLPHRPPLSVKLRARASAATSPGTWGFGLWNEPLSASLGFGSGRKLPALPQAAWFFFASPQNHLTLRDDLPGQGAMAASYASPGIPSLLLAPGLLALPLLVWRPTARWLRRAAAKAITQDAQPLDIDPQQWHDYEIAWREAGLVFRIDGATVLVTQVTPHPPLGLVIWLDNQFAAWAPDGRIGYGTLPNPASWVEISGLTITH